jgi:hyperosmotically inducible periplasmic protein
MDMRALRTCWVAVVAAALLTTACAATDTGISTAVKTKLAADDDVKAYQIDVDTKDKIVTLTGNVETATAKARAVEIARTTDGVASVVDNLKLTGAMASQPELYPPPAERAMFSDAALTASIKTKFAADPTVSALRIDVDTMDQTVTLSGEVRSEAERDQALKLAREVEGVKSVNDRLTLRR